jgi:RNA polymerase sigma factor (TIGR02999 family)
LRLGPSTIVNDITHYLNAADAGDPQALEQLFLHVYGELRQLAAAQMAQERPGHTLNATALVHEAYLRMVPGNVVEAWKGQLQFFAAAAEAMRRILIENARRKRSQKRGGNHTRAVLDPEQIAAPERADDLLALDEALRLLAEAEPQVAELVRLRHFAGLTIPQAAEVLSVSPRTADAWWAYARAWLLAKLEGSKA